MILQLFKQFRPGMALSAAAGVLLTGTSAIAADRVVLTYGPFQAPIKVSDLKNFAETGEKTKTIGQIVGFSGVDEDTIRGLMTLEVGFDLVPFSCLICSPKGVELIEDLALTARTHRRVENVAAIHAAMINAVSDDGKISFIDFLEKYPVPGLYVDIGSIPETVERIQSLAGELDTVLKDATRYGKAGCSIQEVSLPEPAPPAPRPTPPAPQPRPVPPPPVPAPQPPVRGLW
ncbi:MAG: alpha/beta hydrolase [Oscillatoriales cyanobacterium RM2_1_1]|nr:alpha/beta hydrolase [Oscillatoriales cyanobacterium SM2_3_0]NJO44754.1 alpha/beta hydrolase [Oscillatoriales cyanobacterium RM2_1_1]